MRRRGCHVKDFSGKPIGYAFLGTSTAGRLPGRGSKYSAIGFPSARKRMARQSEQELRLHMARKDVERLRGKVMAFVDGSKRTGDRRKPARVPRRGHEPQPARELLLEEHRALPTLEAVKIDSCRESRSRKPTRTFGMTRSDARRSSRTSPAAQPSRRAENRKLSLAP